MPLDTAASWVELASPDMLELLRAGAPPQDLYSCRYSAWESVLEFYCDQNYCTENLRFLWDLWDWKASPSVVKAEEIVEQDIYGDPPLNLYSSSKEPIDEWYRDEDHELDVNLFDGAESEVYESFQGTFQTFLASVSRAQQELPQLEANQSGQEAYAAQWTGDEPTIEVSEPEAQEFDISQVDMAVVDNWNQLALKDLDEGQQTAFAQWEDLVIIQHPTDSGAQPYWAWAQTQDWFVSGAYIKMEKKGRMLDPGRIRVMGGRPGSGEWLEAAIGRVSKKKVVY
jgi:hypothetical protein